MSAPESSPADPAAIERRYGALVIVGFRDARLAKVAICRCACGNVVERSVEALTAGDISSCGNCRTTAAEPAEPAADFAADLANLESLGARRRHRGAA
jgi:hypothetical protein